MVRLFPFCRSSFLYNTFFCFFALSLDWSSQIGCDIRLSDTHFKHTKTVLVLSAHLARADRAPVVIQYPDLPVVLYFSIVRAVARAVLAVWTPAVKTSVHVEAHCVIRTGVPP